MHSKRHTLSRRIARHWQLYVFLLLPLIYLLIFHYYPMTGVQIAFKKYSARLGIWGSPWVGLKNIQKFFNSVRFTTIVGNTLRLSLYSLIAGFPLPVIFALMLGVMRNERYKKVVQTITYMPHFISVVVLVSMILQIFNPILGIYGKAYSALFGTAAPDLLGSPAALLPGAARGRADRRRQPLPARAARRFARHPAHGDHHAHPAHRQGDEHRL